MKIEKLTTDQEAKIIQVKNFWLDYIFSCKNSLNREKATASIEWLYKFCGLNKPIIIYVDSPMGCQLGLQYAKIMLKSVPLDKSLWAQVRAQVWDQVRDQVRAQVGAQVGAQVRAQVGDQVGDQIGAQVGAQVWDQVWDQKFESFANYGNLTDYNWVSFFDFFTEIGVINHSDFKAFKNLLLSGIYDMIQLNGFCIVSNMPDAIQRDEQNRLHCENNSAIHFRDDYQLYYWHGVNVIERWIKNPESVTKEEFINEKNAEKRRCLKEILGNERLIKLLDVEIIDKDVDSFNYPIKLFRTKTKDELIDDFIYFLNVIDPSTTREYYLCVPECKNVWEAKSWTFGNKKIEIRHGDVGLLNLSKEFTQPIFES